MNSAGPLPVLRRRPEWAPAVDNLHDLLSKHGDAALLRVEDYGRLYQGRRGSMLVDVVTSRQRRYGRGSFVW